MNYRECKRGQKNKGNRKIILIKKFKCPFRWKPDTIGQTRKADLRVSIELLSVANLYFSNYTLVNNTKNWVRVQQPPRGRGPFKAKSVSHTVPQHCLPGALCKGTKRCFPTAKIMLSFGCFPFLFSSSLSIIFIQSLIHLFLKLW